MPTDIAPAPASVDPDVQAIYGELNNRGVFKSDPEAQAIGHELRARGAIVDPTQGGIFPTQGGLVAPPAAARAAYAPESPYATLDPQERAVADKAAQVATQVGTNPLLHDIATLQGASGQNFQVAPPKPQPKTLPPEQWGTPGTPIYQDAQRLGGIVSRPVVGGHSPQGVPNPAAMTVATFGKGGAPRFYGANGERLPVSDPRVAAYIGANPGATSLSDVGQALKQIPEQFPQTLETTGQGIKDVVSSGVEEALQSTGIPGLLGANHPVPTRVGKVVNAIGPSTGNLVSGTAMLPFQAAQAGTAAALAPINPQAARETAEFQQGNLNAAGFGPGGPMQKIQAGDVKGGVSQLLQAAEEHPVEAVGLFLGGVHGLHGAGLKAGGLLRDGLLSRAEVLDHQSDIIDNPTDAKLLTDKADILRAQAARLPARAGKIAPPVPEQAPLTREAPPEAPAVPASGAAAQAPIETPTPAEAPVPAATPAPQAPAAESQAQPVNKTLTEPQAKPVPAEPKPAPAGPNIPVGQIPDAAAFKAAFLKHFKLPEEEINMATAIAQSHAQAWAAAKPGRSVQDWYTSRIAEIAGDENAATEAPKVEPPAPPIAPATAKDAEPPAPKAETSPPVTAAEENPAPISEKHPSALTRADMTSVPLFNLPKGSYRGELRDANKNIIGNVYVVNGRAIIAEPREYGRGELEARIPGDFDPKSLIKDGGFHVSSNNYAQYWKFRPKGEAGAPEAPKAETAPPSEAPKAEAPKPEEPKIERPEQPGTGKAGKAYTADNEAVPFHWDIRDAGELVTSHKDSFAENPQYDQSLQPRDRTRVASAEQIMAIERKLTPERLAESPSTSEGAPIIGPDNQVESGNGRSIAIRRSYGAGGPNSAAYRDFVASKAKELGIDPAKVKDLKNPVLVRVRDGDLSPEDRSDLADRMGKSAVATMSETETALNDAKWLRESGIIKHVVPTADGNVSGAANRDFVRAFNGHLDPSERASMEQSDGSLSAQGQRRIKNAVLAAAYNEPGNLSRMTEATDDNVKGVGQAMLATAPKFAQLKADIASGARHDLDITSDIAAAANTLSYLRDEGRSVPEHLAQMGLFGETLSPIGKELLSTFDNYKRSPAKIADLLDTYVTAAEKAGDPRNGDLFGGEAPSRDSVFKAALETVEKRHGKTATTQGAMDFGTEAKPGARGNNQAAAGGPNAPANPQVQTRAPARPGPATPEKPVAPDVLFQNESPNQKEAPTFYSLAEKVIQAKMGGKASAEQIRGMLQSNGVKPEEMKWTNLGQFLDDNAARPITKQEVLEHLAGNQVELNEITKGKATGPKDIAEAKARIAAAQKVADAAREERDASDEAIEQKLKSLGYDDKYIDSLSVRWANGDEAAIKRLVPDEFAKAKEIERRYIDATNALIDEESRLSKGSTTKYETYQLPGGMDYREMLLQLPVKSLSDNAAAESHYETFVRRGGEPAWNELSNAEKQKYIKETPSYGKSDASQTYRSEHWDEPNVLAHIRMSDRVGPNDEKILHVEEIQSDWHQTGRKEGYQRDLPSEPSTWTAKQDTSIGADSRPAWTVRDTKGEVLGYSESRNESDAISDVAQQYKDQGGTGGVPNAPFSKTWHELAAKKILDHAARNGYDKVAWTKGAEQAERYDLSKQVDEISYEPKRNGSTGSFAAWRAGKPVIVEEDVPPSKLANYVGEELARKLLDTPKDKWSGVHTLAGDDLKVGGEGMKGFYDKILPDTFNKLGKRFGAKVGETAIHAVNRGDYSRFRVRFPDGFTDETHDSLEQAKAAAERWNTSRYPQYHGGIAEATPVKETLLHSIEITPEMRRSLKSEGQTLFQKPEEGRKEQYEKNLVAVHNTDANGILAADRLGGIPAPSLAITRRDLPFETFGDISLVGKRGMIDPETYPGHKVYGSDVYSPRQPRESYTVNEKALNDFVAKKVNPAIQAEGSARNYYSWEQNDVARENTKERLISDIARDAEVRAAFLKDQGKPVEIPTKDQYGQTRLDRWELRNRTDEALKAIPNHDEAVENWVRSHIETAFKGPFLAKGTRKVPYTLDNLITAMTGKGIRGQEGGMFSNSLGAIRARGVKAFPTVAAMHKAEGSLVSRADFQNYKDQTDQEWNDFQKEVFNAHQRAEDRYGSMQVYDQAQEALSDYVKGAKTAANLRAALRRWGFTGEIDTATIQKGMDIADRLLKSPTEYFEAKPTRAVRLREFAGAVVPKDTNPDVIAALKAHGLDIHEYDKSIPGDRNAKLQELAGKHEGALFQEPGEKGPKGSVQFLSDNRAIIRALNSPDISTVVHELGHIFRRDLEGRDLKTVEDWAGVKGGNWEVDHEEKFARGFERYLADGHAPTEALKSVFEKFKNWLTAIYKGITGSSIDVQISPEVKAVFDKMLGKEEESAAKAPAKVEGWTEKQPGTVWHRDSGNAQIIKTEDGTYTLYAKGKGPEDFRTLEEAVKASEKAVKASAGSQRVGSINMRLFTGDEDAYAQIKDQYDRINSLKRDSLTRDQIREFGKALGLSYEDVEQMRPGVFPAPPEGVRPALWNAAYMDAIRNLHSKAQAELVDAKSVTRDAREEAQENPGPDALKAEKDATVAQGIAQRHAELMHQYDSETANVLGVGLSARNQPSVGIRGEGYQGALLAPTLDEVLGLPKTGRVTETMGEGPRTPNVPRPRGAKTSGAPKPKASGRPARVRTITPEARTAAIAAYKASKGPLTLTQQAEPKTRKINSKDAQKAAAIIFEHPDMQKGYMTTPYSMVRHTDSAGHAYYEYPHGTEDIKSPAAQDIAKRLNSLHPSFEGRWIISRNEGPLTRPMYEATIGERGYKGAFEEKPQATGSRGLQGVISSASMEYWKDIGGRHGNYSGPRVPDVKIVSVKDLENGGKRFELVNHSTSVFGSRAIPSTSQSSIAPAFFKLLKEQIEREGEAHPGSVNVTGHHYDEKTPNGAYKSVDVDWRPGGIEAAGKSVGATPKGDYLVYNADDGREVARFNTEAEAFRHYRELMKDQNRNPDSPEYGWEYSPQSSDTLFQHEAAEPKREEADPKTEALVTIGKFHYEDGQRNYPDWKAAVEKDIGGKLTDEEAQWAYQLTRDDLTKAVRDKQVSALQPIFVDRLSGELSRKGATQFLMDVGDDVRNRLIRGDAPESYTPAERQLIAGAYDDNQPKNRKPPTKQAATIAKQIATDLRAPKPRNAPPRTLDNILRNRVKGGAESVAKIKADLGSDQAGQSALAKIQSGEEMTVSEERRLARAIDTYRKTTPTTNADALTRRITKLVSDARRGRLGYDSPLEAARTQMLADANREFESLPKGADTARRDKVKAAADAKAAAIASDLGKITDEHDTGAIAAVMLRHSDLNKWNQVDQFVLGNILSSPDTGVKIAVSHPATVAAEEMRRWLFGDRSEIRRGVRAGVQGVKARGIPEARQIMREGSTAANLAGTAWYKPLGGRIPVESRLAAWRYLLRAHSAYYQLMQTYNVERGLHLAATEDGKARGLTGQALNDHVSDVLARPERHRDLAEKAIKFGEEETQTAPNPIAKVMSQMAAQYPGLRAVKTTLLPVANLPLNALQRTLEAQTGLLTSRAMARMYARLHPDATPEEIKAYRDKVFQRGAVGAGIAGLSALGAYHGIVTPSDPEHHRYTARINAFGHSFDVPAGSVGAVMDVGASLEQDLKNRDFVRLPQQLGAPLIEDNPILRASETVTGAAGAISGAAQDQSSANRALGGVLSEYQPMSGATGFGAKAIDAAKGQARKAPNLPFPIGALATPAGNVPVLRQRVYPVIKGKQGRTQPQPILHFQRAEPPGQLRQENAQDVSEDRKTLRKGRDEWRKLEAAMRRR